MLGEKPDELIQSGRLLPLVDWYLKTYAHSHSHTSRAKQLDLQHFLDYLVRAKRTANSVSLKISDWDHSSTEQFVDICLKRGEAPATAARRLATLKHMGRVIAEQVAGFVNPARGCKPPKLETLRPKALTGEEINEVRDHKPAAQSGLSAYAQARNQLLVHILLRTGLRADEVRSLRLGQLSEDFEWFANVRTKGRRFRRVYIPSDLRDELARFLELRDTEVKRYLQPYSRSIDLRLPLLVSGHGSSRDDIDSFLMSPKSIWRTVRQHSVDTKLHPHLLRHTFATELLDSSRDIRLVAQALGHSDVRVTMRYTERTDEEVAKAIEKGSAADERE
jgi:integrase/recombinase XerC